MPKQDTQLMEASQNPPHVQKEEMRSTFHNLKADPISPQVQYLINL